MIETNNATPTRRDLRAEINEIRSDLRKLRTDVGGLVRTLKDAGVKEVRDAGAAARTESHNRFDQLKRAVDQAGECGSAALERARHQVQQRPFLMIAGALAAGYVLGTILKPATKERNPEAANGFDI